MQEKKYLPLTQNENSTKSITKKKIKKQATQFQKRVACFLT